MRGPIAILGGFFLVCSAGLIYAERKSGAELSQAAEESVRQLLISHNASAATQAEAQIQRGVRDAAAALQRVKKKPKGRAYAGDLTLIEPEAPKWVWSHAKRVKAAGLPEFPELESALQDFGEGPLRMQGRQFGNKFYLFVKGGPDSDVFAAAYEPEGLFSDFGSTGGVRTWVILEDGYVAFHTQPRFLGSNATNLRPVAGGLRALAEGRSHAFAEKYLSLDGKNSLGAWSALPRQGLLVGSEWTKSASPVSASFYAWAALATAVLGAFALGFAVSSGQAPVEKAEPIFEVESRLDQDALDYLATVKGSAEQAIEYAKEQEKIALEASRQRGIVAGQFRFLEWKLRFLEDFQEQVLVNATGKQVWPALGRLIAERTPGLIVNVYRYAPSTFSLVPEALATSLDLDKSAEAYFTDARIFIGTPHLIRSVLNTEAFERWNRARERHMPLHATEFRFFPLEYGGGLKGLILIAFDSGMNRDSELEEAFSLHEALIARASSFCDSLGRLLQSSHAKGTSGATVAGASNDARGQPRPS